MTGRKAAKLAAEPSRCSAANARKLLTITEIYAPQLLRMRYKQNREGGVGRIFFRCKGTIWQNANALIQSDALFANLPDSAAAVLWQANAILSAEESIACFANKFAGNLRQSQFREEKYE